MSGPANSRRRIVVAAFSTLTLLALAAVAVVDHARLSRLERSVQADDNAAVVAHLSSQYASLATDMQTLKAAPRAASETSVTALEAQWEPRLSALENGTLAYAPAHDLATLTARVDDLEKRLARAQRRSRTSTSAVIQRPLANSSSSPPTRPDPPFLPLGIELRGGERFLSIIPAGASSIAQAHALRPGDREGSWILERLERDSAVFRVDGELQRLSVPQ